jgi:uncharacterized coiled-coil protein SlyX
MARGRSTTADEGPGPASGSAVEVQAPPARLAAAAARHDALVAKVARRRAVRDALVADTRQAVSQVAMRMHALVEEMRRLDGESHALLQALIDDPARSRSQRAELARIYRSLEGDVISARPRPGVRGRAGWDEPADEPPPRGRGRAARGHEPTGEPYTPSRPRPAERGTLRALFRRLAEALHPDKVQDDGERARRTEVMKQVTVAYQEGDYARLVEIELAWAAAVPTIDVAALDVDELARRIAVKERAIAELETQLAALERELRKLRASADGRLARAYAEHGGADGRLPDEREAAADLERMRAVRDFILDFRDGRISFARFREGPGPDDDDGLVDPLADELDDVLADLRAELRGAPREVVAFVEELEQLARDPRIDPRAVLRAVQAAAHGAGVGPRRRRR